MRVLIVDDEKLARARLRRLLEELTQSVDIVGEAASADEAAALVTELRPDLIFLDILMPGKSGLEMMAELEDPPAVIFVTAHDTFALKAFEVNAVDYLLKPVHPERLEAALARVKVEETSDVLNKLLQTLKPSTKGFLERLSVRKGDRILFLKAVDIIYFKSEDKYTFAATHDSTEIVDLTLSALEESLDPDKFTRIHRSAIINLGALKEIRRLDSGQYHAVLDDARNTLLPISRSYLKKILPQ